MLQFRSAIMDAMSALSKSSSVKKCLDIKSNLEEIRAELNKEVLDVAEGLRHYTELVDSYYSQCAPFGTGKKDDDYQCFMELIGHSIVIGNYFLLEKWAVRYAVDNKGRLAQPISKYANTFNEIINNQWEQVSNQYEWPSQAKFYCEYLVKSWMKETAG